jgi:hypothetical protein
VTFTITSSGSVISLTPTATCSRLDGRLPFDSLQPTQRRDEAAGGDRDHLPSAHVHHRFFRQNFGWLVRNIAGWPAFVTLGVGVEIVAVVILVTFFRRRGWF